MASRSGQGAAGGVRRHNPHPAQMRPDRRPVGQTETAGDRRAVRPPGQRPEESGSGRNLHQRRTDIQRLAGRPQIQLCRIVEDDPRTGRDVGTGSSRRGDQIHAGKTAGAGTRHSAEAAERRKAATAAGQTGRNTPPATVPADTTGFSRSETLRAAAGRNRRYAIYAGAMAAVAGEPDAADNRSPQRCKYAARILVRQYRRVATHPYRPAPQG